MYDKPKEKYYIYNNRSLNRKERLEPLTVCIAAIQKGTFPSIVFCADRLVSAGIQFELGEPKIQPLTPNCLVMIAGDALQGEIIIHHTKERVKNSGNNASVEQIATILSEEYKNTLNFNINTEILNSFGLAVQSLPNEIGSLPNWLVKNILEYSLGVGFLVFGIEVNSDSESGTGYLYKIGEKGKMDNYSTIGFASIGSGGVIADSELSKHTFTIGQKLSEVMYRVFVSKKVAERVIGVGESTDFRILTFLPNETPQKHYPYVWSVNNSDAMLDLEKTYEKQKTIEAEILRKLNEELYEKIFKPQSVN